MKEKIRIQKILDHPSFREHIAKIQELEADREFCRHDMGHFLDVARIAQILNLTEKRGVCEEWIYAAGLLHDIGRYEQYMKGTPHEEASAQYAVPILCDCGFDEEETCVILTAIARHRESEAMDEDGLTGLLYRADKMSRSCFACQAEKKCDWKAEKKNAKLVW